MKSITIRGCTLELVRGDITEQKVDAIVTAANSSLAGGGGVDGAVHRVGGPAILDECRKIGGCPTGFAVITGAGNLPAKHVIHAVGPIYHDGKRNEPQLLSAAYHRSLELALDHKLNSIAFPSISTGAYGYPLHEAAGIALSTVVNFLMDQEGLKLVRFVLFDEVTEGVYVEMLTNLKFKRGL